MVYATFFKEGRGREIFRGGYPFSLMSKGGRKKKRRRESLEA
jgi:hypothetical protein